MLVRLLTGHLKPYTGLLVAVVVFQLVGTIASLYLPTLNADIIDNGVAKGDTEYILQVGAVMLGITLVQVACTIAAVWFGARSAMGFGRDVRNSLFHTVTDYSTQEVDHFGAPSLITIRMRRSSARASIRAWAHSSASPSMFSFSSPSRIIRPRLRRTRRHGASADL